MTTNGSSSSELLPGSISSFAPVALLELVAAAVSNILLIALIVKASLRHVQNNTNIYLLSFGILGLIQSFNIFTLFVTVSARKWIFGPVLCGVSVFTMKLHLFSPLFLHLMLSRDRYKAVRDPFNWQPKSRLAYISTTIIWGLAVTYSTLFTLKHAIIGFSDYSGKGFYVCYISIDIVRRDNGAVAVVACTVHYVITISTLVITLTYYILILKDLHLTERLRIQHSMLSPHVIVVNGRDKPLECTSEERAARSLAMIFLFQFACSMLSNLLLSIRLLEAVAKDVSIRYAAHSAEIVLWLIIYLLPAINPTFLTLTNKRFRSRVLELFQCELRTNGEIEDANPFSKRASSIKLAHSIASEKGVQTPVLLFVRQGNISPKDEPSAIAGEGDVRSNSCETYSTTVESRQSVGDSEPVKEVLSREAWTTHESTREV